MGIEEVQQALLNHHGLRVTPAMSQYILQHPQFHGAGKSVGKPTL